MMLKQRTAERLRTLANWLHPASRPPLVTLLPSPYRDHILVDGVEYVDVRKQQPCRALPVHAVDIDAAHKRAGKRGADGRFAKRATRRTKGAKP